MMAKSRFTVSPQFKALHWRLLLSSLGVIGCTIATFGIVVYQVVAHSLEKESDRQLQLLADAAAHSLPDIQSHRANILSRTERTIDNDGDLDIPWQDLQQDQQSVEWFDATGKPLARAGKLFPVEPFLIPSATADTNKKDDSEESTEDGNEDDQKNQSLHTLIVSVYAVGTTAAQPKVQGYIRVSTSTTATAQELERLRIGMQWGGLFALILSGIGGAWLTRQSLQPIEQSIQQLKQFTADASHELRNPLTVIQTSVAVMQTHPERIQPADLRKLEAIDSATRQMSQLVDDLLWLARSDRQHTSSPSPRISIPIEELLEELVDQYLPQAEQRNIHLKAELNSNVTVNGDANQLKRLFANLIANALQYTSAGGTVTLASSLEDDWVIICVQDTGIGIAPEHLPYVFDRFWRADQARAHREGGSGLGLAIAQAIVHQHHGTITVRSQPGQGSCFQVELPIQSFAD